METIIERTTQEDQRIALSSMSHFRDASKRIAEIKKGSIKIKIQETGEFISIPRKALTFLLEIISSMAEGKSITLIPSDSEISTQQAADMLNVSRPHLVKLLENGEIPFKKVGSHRRVFLQDLIEYERRLAKTREEKMQFLAKQAQDLNLGYE
jgi:excisionase family DNA binding protein